MATTKKTPLKKEILDDNHIIEIYMNYVLDHSIYPNNVYKFCKDNIIDESLFYKYFGNLDVLKQTVWVKFIKNAIEIIEKDENYASYSDKNKLLTLFYTLFEILTLNRSYVLFSMAESEDSLKNLKHLKKFKTKFKDFIVQIIEDNESESFVNSDKIKKPIFSEGAWIQFLFILNFWKEDASASFEKTDIIIEKSVNTVVDLLDTKPLESLFDLGKFLWKERKM